MTRRRRPRTAQERVIGVLGTVAPGSLGGRIRNSRPAVVPTRNTGQQPDTTPGFDPNETPVIIGHLATGGGGSTPTSLTGASARIVAVGASSSVGGTDAVAVGDTADAGAQYAIAVGSGASTDGVGSIAIGHSSAAFGASHVVVGEMAGVDLTSASAGSTSTECVIVGYGAACHSTRSVAIGSSADAGNPFASSDMNTAIGYNARSKHIQSTALGANSVSTEDHQVMLGTHSDFVEIPGDSSTAPNGLVQTDTADGTRYIIQITSGALVLSAAP